MKSLFALALFSIVSFSHASIPEETFTSSHYKAGLVRHIVLFRYASNVTAFQKNQIKARFLNLKNTCLRNGRPYIVSIEAGSQNSFEQADQGLEQGFIVTFNSQGDRNYYVGHPVVADEKLVDPAHDAFKKIVGPLLDNNGVIVFDFAR